MRKHFQVEIILSIPTWPKCSITPPSSCPSSHWCPFHVEESAVPGPSHALILLSTWPPTELGPQLLKKNKQTNKKKTKAFLRRVKFCMRTKNRKWHVHINHLICKTTVSYYRFQLTWNQFWMMKLFFMFVKFRYIQSQISVYLVGTGRTTKHKTEKK